MLIGCATIFTSTTDNINVETDNKNAQIYVDKRLIGKKNVDFEIRRKNLVKNIC